MCLRAHGIHRPFATIGQTHILSTIWQFGGKELKRNTAITSIKWTFLCPASVGFLYTQIIYLSQEQDKVNEVTSGLGKR